MVKINFKSIQLCQSNNINSVRIEMHIFVEHPHAQFVSLPRIEQWIIPSLIKFVTVAFEEIRI